MNILSCLLVAAGLSMDNFAVTIASGCCHHQRVGARYVWTVSVTFALAHFVMFSAGWLCGEAVGRYIEAVDHWAAFVLLAYIGGQMLLNARKSEAGPDVCRVHSFKTVLALSVATSLDALVVGIGWAFSGAPFWLAVWLLTACVLLTSSTGFYLGAWLGRRFGKAMEALGGAALIVIGIKLLLEGVGIW